MVGVGYDGLIAIDFWIQVVATEFSWRWGRTDRVWGSKLYFGGLVTIIVGTVNVTVCHPVNDHNIDENCYISRTYEQRRLDFTISVTQHEADPNMFAIQSAQNSQIDERAHQTDNAAHEGSTRHCMKTRVAVGAERIELAERSEEKYSQVDIDSRLHG